MEKRAYYLPWGENGAYAVELASSANLFFTAELTGCGLIIFTAPGKTIVVHHNIQVQRVPQGWFERTATYEQRDRVHTYGVRMQALYDLTQHILADHPEITGGKLLNVHHYGHQARVFGIRGGYGGWRLYINRQWEGSYRTDLLYA